MPTRGKTRLQRKLKLWLVRSALIFAVDDMTAELAAPAPKKSLALWPKAGLCLADRLLDMASGFDDSSARRLKAALP